MLAGSKWCPSIPRHGPYENLACRSWVPPEASGACSAPVRGKPPLVLRQLRAQGALLSGAPYPATAVRPKFIGEEKDSALGGG